MDNIFKKLIIFEMANNHQGSMDHAKYIILKLGAVVKKYNLNAAVKFQYRDLDTLVHPAYKERTDVKHIPRFYSTKMFPDDFYNLATMVKEQGLRTMCTPFDEPSVDICREHGIDILKIASCSSTDWPLLEKVASTQKSIIISTGGSLFQILIRFIVFFA